MAEGIVEFSVEKLQTPGGVAELNRIIQYLYANLVIPSSGAYTTTNVTPDRTYNANATSTDELADVLGTLIADLKTTGIIS